MCMASSFTGLVQQPQPLWVRKYHSPAKGAASQRFFPNRSCSASRGLFCDQLLQGQKVIAFPAVPVWQGLWVVLGLLCTGSSVRTWSSTSYLSPRKCGRGVFLSQHLFAFPMQIPSSGFSIPLNLWAQLFSIMDMEAHDGSPLQPLTAWRLPAKCIFDLWLRLPFPCSCFLFSTISYLFFVTTYCAMLTWRINNYSDGPQ